MSWKDYLNKENEEEYFQKIREFLDNCDNRDLIYPPKGMIFNAFNQTKFDDIKVVIIGQDPYHGTGQANGLAFSVNENIKIPPSLKNIFKEIKRDFGYETPDSGDLTKWARQGVFLLNTILTVEHSKPESHKEIGWHIFTNRTIEYLSNNKENLVFMLWGNHAKNKEQFIDTSKHLILKSTHPSPFSAHKGFLGCSHFSKANEYLKSIEKDIINWN